MGRGGGEGRVPNLMTAAAEREDFDSYLFSFVFDVSSVGHSASTGTSWGLHQPQGNITLGN
jgi:hypothetical protein